MNLWRYKAVPLSRSEGEASITHGEFAAESAADLRAALRRLGLQVIDIREVSPRNRNARTSKAGNAPHVFEHLLEALEGRWHAHLRRRRTSRRAELYDSLATLLESGLPLLEAVETTVNAGGAGNPRRRRMLLQLREDLRGGASLSEAMSRFRGWFDPCEVAMVRAGQHSGSLTDVLRGLGERQEHSGELGQKLIGALAYPAIVAMVGLGVVLFLSKRTLPQLAGILQDAGIQTPGLTRAIIGVGRAFTTYGWALAMIAACAFASALVIRSLVIRTDLAMPRWLRRFSPALPRRLAVARFCLQFTELLRSGVPAAEALRVIAPAAPLSLRRVIEQGSAALERGDDLSTAMSDERWFDAEFRRLLEVGQSSGELPTLLEKIGRRYERGARRSIDRLASMLEPCVILALAVLVGLVAMGAVLPLLRIQEVL